MDNNVSYLVIVEDSIVKPCSSNQSTDLSKAQYSLIADARERPCILQIIQGQTKLCGHRQFVSLKLFEGRIYHGMTSQLSVIV